MISWGTNHEYCQALPSTKPGPPLGTQFCSPVMVRGAKGGSRGLGKNMAIAIAKKGIDLVITYNSNKEAADKVVEEIKSLGQKAVAFQLDTGDTKRFDNFIDQLTTYLKAETGEPYFYFLINNVGTALYAPVTDVTEEQMDAIYNIHFLFVGIFAAIDALPVPLGIFCIHANIFVGRRPCRYRIHAPVDKYTKLGIGKPGWYWALIKRCPVGIVSLALAVQGGK